MTLRISFSVPGEPRGKGRPRFAKGRAYTDAATASYENLIAINAKAAMAGREPLATPVDVWVRINMQPPSSASKSRIALMLSGDLRPIKRPDIENVAKAVLDAMNQIVFRDDAQVCGLRVAKFYDSQPGLTIDVEEVLP